MPFIRTTVNVNMTEKNKEKLKTDFGKEISIVSGKAECYLMLAFHDGVTMAYQGDTSPCAMVEVSLLGSADARELDKLTAAITESIEKELKISPARVYVNYTEFKYWGVDGHNV